MMVSMFAVMIITGVVWVVYDEIRDDRVEAARELRRLQARAEILDCMKNDPEHAVFHCTEEAQVRHMCTHWPVSWEGKR